MVVNGRTWPTHTVEAKQYRLRVLNGCSARFLTLSFSTTPDGDPAASPRLPFYLLGTSLPRGKALSSVATHLPT